MKTLRINHRVFYLNLYLQQETKRLRLSEIKKNNEEKNQLKKVGSSIQLQFQENINYQLEIKKEKQKVSNPLITVDKSLKMSFVFATTKASKSKLAIYSDFYWQLKLLPKVERSYDYSCLAQQLLAYLPLGSMKSTISKAMQLVAAKLQLLNSQKTIHLQKTCRKNSVFYPLPTKGSSYLRVDRHLKALAVGASSYFDDLNNLLYFEHLVRIYRFQRQRPFSHGFQLDSLFNLFLLQQSQIKNKNMLKIQTPPSKSLLSLKEQLGNNGTTTGFKKRKQVSPAKIYNNLPFLNALFSKKGDNTNLNQTISSSLFYQPMHYLSSTKKCKACKSNRLHLQLKQHVNKKLIFTANRTSDIIWSHQKIYDFLSKFFYLGQCFFKKNKKLNDKLPFYLNLVFCLHKKIFLYKTEITRHWNRERDMKATKSKKNFLLLKKKLKRKINDRRYIIHKDNQKFNDEIFSLQTRTFAIFDLLQSNTKKIKTIPFFEKTRKQQKPIHPIDNDLFSSGTETNYKTSLFLNTKGINQKNFSFNSYKNYAWVYLNKKNMVHFFRVCTANLLKGSMNCLSSAKAVHVRGESDILVYKQRNTIQRGYDDGIRQESNNLRYLLTSVVSSFNCNKLTISKILRQRFSSSYFDVQCFITIIKCYLKVEPLVLYSSWEQKSQSNLLSFSISFFQKKKKVQGFPCFLVTKRVVNNSKSFENFTDRSEGVKDSRRQHALPLVAAEATTNIMKNFKVLKKLRFLGVKKKRISSSLINLTSTPTQSGCFSKIGFFINVEYIAFSFLWDLLNSKLLLSTKTSKLRKETNSPTVLLKQEVLSSSIVSKPKRQKLYNSKTNLKKKLVFFCDQSKIYAVFYLRPFFLLLEALAATKGTFGRELQYQLLPKVGKLQRNSKHIKRYKSRFKKTKLEQFNSEDSSFLPNKKLPILPKLGCTSLQLKRLKYLVKNSLSLPVNELILKLNKEIFMQMKWKFLRFFSYTLLEQIEEKQFQSFFSRLVNSEKKRRIVPLAFRQPIFLLIGKFSFLGSLQKTCHWIPFQTKTYGVQLIKEIKNRKLQSNAFPQINFKLKFKNLRHLKTTKTKELILSYSTNPKFRSQPFNQKSNYTGKKRNDKKGILLKNTIVYDFLEGVFYPSEEILTNPYSIITRVENKKTFLKQLQFLDTSTKSLKNKDLQSKLQPRDCAASATFYWAKLNSEAQLSLQDFMISEKRSKNFLFQILWKWARRRHNNRSNRWIFHRYWHKNLFYYENKLSKYYLLDSNLQSKKYSIL